MANRITKYFLLGTGANFTAFDLDYAEIGLTESTISFKGNGGVDAVYVANGFAFDFTESLGGVDKLYLQSASSDYSYSYDADGDVLTLTHKTITSTSIKVSPADQVVFSNGAVSAQEIVDNLPAGNAVLDTALLNALVQSPANSAAFLAQTTGTEASTLKAFALDANGATFGQVPAGVPLIIKGNQGVDMVYVAAGSTVDFSESLGGQDKIFLTGNAGDYEGAFDADSELLTLTRTVNTNQVEKVIVGAGDLLVFADGAATTTAVIAYAQGGSEPTLDTDVRTPGLNEAPTLANAIADQSVAEDSALNFTIASDAFADLDGDTLTYTTSTLPAWLSFNASTRTFTGTPANGDVGNVNVTVTANDGNGGTVTDTFTITVTNTNDAPTVANPIADQTVAEDSALNFQFASNVFADVDNGDTLTYTTSELPAWLSFNASTRTFSGTPTNGDVGLVNVTVTADDGNGGTGTVSDTFTITVTNTNDAPTVANAIADQTVAEDAALSFQFASNVFADLDGDTLTYTTSTLPAWLSFNASTRTFSGTPDNGDVGNVNVTVTANDGNGGTVSDTFTVTVTNIDDPATASLTVTGSPAEGSTLTANLTDLVDQDGSPTIAYQWQQEVNGDWTNISDQTNAAFEIPSDNSLVGQAVRIKVTTTDERGGSTEFLSDSFTVTDVPSALSGTSVFNANLVNYSTEIGSSRVLSSAAVWGNGAVTVTTDAIVAPDGTTTAEVVQSSTLATAGIHVLDYRSVDLLPRAPGTYTSSLYVKQTEANTASTFALGVMDTNEPTGLPYVRFNIAQNGVVSFASQTGTGILGAGVEDVGSGWYRVYVTTNNTTEDTVGATYRVRLYTNNGSSTLGTGEAAFAVWGLQHEAGTLGAYVNNAGVGAISIDGANSLGGAVLTAQELAQGISITVDLSSAEAGDRLELGYLNAESQFQSFATPLLGATLSGTETVQTVNFDNASLFSDLEDQSTVQFAVRLVNPANVGGAHLAVGNSVTVDTMPGNIVGTPTFNSNRVVYSDEIAADRTVSGGQSWSKSAVSATQNALIAPDGTMTAEVLFSTTVATAAQHYTDYRFPGSSVIEAGTYTTSVYVKQTEVNTASTFSLGIYDATKGDLNGSIVSGTPYARFSINANGEVSYLNKTGIELISAGVEKVGSGWYRVYITTVNVLPNENDADYRVRMYTNNGSSTLGTGEAAFAVWGLQHEAGTLGAYVNNAGVGATSIDGANSLGGAVLTAQELAQGISITADLSSAEAGDRLELGYLNAESQFQAFATPLLGATLSGTETVQTVNFDNASLFSDLEDQSTVQFAVRLVNSANVGGTHAAVGNSVTVDTMPGNIVGTPQFNANLVNYSTEIGSSRVLSSAAVWGRSGVTVTTDTVVAPDGTTTAEVVQSSTLATAGQHVLDYRSVDLVPRAPGTYTSSLYVKQTEANTASTFALGVMDTNEPTGAPYVRFNIAQNGVVTFASQTGTGILGAGVEDVGSGWYRVYVTTNNTTEDTVGAAYRVRLYTNNGSSTLGTGEAAFAVWGLQHEAGTLGAYVNNAGVGATSIDGANSLGGAVLTAQELAQGISITVDLSNAKAGDTVELLDASGNVLAASDALSATGLAKQTVTFNNTAPLGVLGDGAVTVAAVRLLNAIGVEGESLAFSTSFTIDTNGAENIRISGLGQTVRSGLGADTIDLSGADAASLLYLSGELATADQVYGFDYSARWEKDTVFMDVSTEMSVKTAAQLIQGGFIQLIDNGNNLDFLIDQDGSASSDFSASTAFKLMEVNLVDLAPSQELALSMLMTQGNLILG